MMTKPENLYEQASYELNQFRERRMAERRAIARDTPDRRKPAATESRTDNNRNDADSLPPP
ncbi:hypothetical protein [Noviherbaspirillum denitrificans]|nr:hypothetical protein [Noviherbaspirillum denitrificans]